MESLAFVHHPTVFSAPPVTEVVMLCSESLIKKAHMRMEVANNTHHLSLESRNRKDPKMIEKLRSQKLFNKRVSSRK